MCVSIIKFLIFVVLLVNCFWPSPSERIVTAFL